MNRDNLTNDPKEEAIPIEATEAGWGRAATDKIIYQPLERVVISIRAPHHGAASYRVEWYDGLGNRYGEASGKLANNTATVEFTAGGFPGMQFAKVWFDPNDGNLPHDRLVNFSLEARTTISCDHASVSALYETSRRMMMLNRRRLKLPEGEVIGYTTADSTGDLDIWLRDMFYNSGGYLLWEHEVTSGLEANWSRQTPDGQFPDWINGEGQSDRMTSESDLEYIAVLALHRTWMVTGDDTWLKKHLPAIERGLKYLTSDPVRWDAANGMVKRGHTCDTWDFDIETDSYQPENRAVAATCDQSGLYAAYRAMAEIRRQLGHGEKARDYESLAVELRQRSINRLWDGEKFRHHLHLTSIDHGTFDETRQLAMGNGWAMTRRLADPEQCRTILGAYENRWKQTGHRFPWWSLEPGFPVEQGKVLQQFSVYLKPGGYCNGGMMPFVGACLAMGAFQNGREELGGTLLVDYADFLAERNGEIYTWFWPDMQPGFRTTTRNTTGHDGWGMGHWVDALVEGVVGLKILEPQLRSVELSPRWASIGVRQARIVIHFPAVDRYVAYEYRQEGNRIRLRLTGSMDQIVLRLLIPIGWQAARIQVNGVASQFTMETAGQSRYAIVRLPDRRVCDIELALE